ncbi:MAG: peptidoglycan editing factor PgeF [Ruminococcaceae bacterium]|nr:peptidoglycan editing factor PgeF [Oscillospiraceae bacterium]
MAFISVSNRDVEFMRSDNIITPHGFTIRQGGVSKGIFDSLNLGVSLGDDPADVRENYRRAMLALEMPLHRLVRSRQVHRDDVLIANESHAIDLYTPIPYEADGLITNIPNLPLMVFTADCIPVLLHDPVGGAIGAVHCGWRSTVMDIAGKAVRMMGESYGSKPENIRAAIGAGISLCCFETGEDVPTGVRKALGGDKFIFPKENGKFMVDLKGVVRELLIRSGLTPENIDTNPECTVCLHDKYWSHRYTKGQRGIQSAVIMLR